MIDKGLLKNHRFSLQRAKFPYARPMDINRIPEIESGEDITKKVWLKVDAGLLTTGSAQFSIDDGSYLDVANNSTLQLDDTSFTFCTWVWLETVSTLGIMLSKEDNGGVTGREFDLFYNSSENGFMFSIWTNGTDRYNVLTSTPTTRQWYFVVAWYDKNANKIYIQLNNGTPTEEDVSGSVVATPTHFTMGLTDSWNLSGKLDNVGFWKRTLSSAERTALYNGGDGVNYSNLSSTIKTNLVSWWDLNELTSQTRVDSHGSNDLTDHNNVIGGVGKVTSAAASGDKVDVWLDQTANGNDAYSDPDLFNNRPNYHVVGDLEFLAFNSDFLATQNFSRSQPQTVVVVGLGIDYANRTIVDGSETNTARIYYSDEVFHPYLSADANPITGDSLANETVAVDNWFIAVAVFDGADSRFYVNAEVVAGDMGTAASDGLKIGASVHGVDDWNGYVTEIIVYDGALSDGQALSVTNYLNDKYNVF